MNIEKWTTTVGDSHFRSSNISYYNRSYMDQRCKACTLRRNLEEADSLLATLSVDGKISKRYRALCFSGQFGEYVSGPFGELPHPHPWLSVEGLAVFKPQIFDLNMYWRYWDVHLLQGTSSPQLSRVKIPIHDPSDCFVLGRALKTMVGLKSLTLTDLPDCIDFFEAFGVLGQAILALCWSLISK